MKSSRPQSLRRNRGDFPRFGVELVDRNELAMRRPVTAAAMVEAR